MAAPSVWAFVSSPLSQGQPEKREPFLSPIPWGLKSGSPATVHQCTSNTRRQSLKPRPDPGRLARTPRPIPGTRADPRWQPTWHLPATPARSRELHDPLPLCRGPGDAACLVLTAWEGPRPDRRPGGHFAAGDLERHSPRTATCARRRSGRHFILRPRRGVLRGTEQTSPSQTRCPLPLGGTSQQLDTWWGPGLATKDCPQGQGRDPQAATGPPWGQRGQSRAPGDGGDVQDARQGCRI